jgi:hypothetical protein
MNPSELWLHVALKVSNLLTCDSEKQVQASATLEGRAKEVASHPHRPLPRPPISSRYYTQNNLKIRSQSVISGQAIKQSIETSLLVASNNDYLLSYHNVTAEAMFSQLSKEGISISNKTYNTLKEGKYYNIGLIIISAMALFWGEPLNRFLSQDYAHLKLKPLRDHPPKNLKPRGTINSNHLRIVYNLSGQNI